MATGGGRPEDPLVSERLSYHAIADHLNLDLDRYRPKTAIRRDMQRATWSASVREVLENPKYTGYMVWNRRVSKTGDGRQNPPREWVWSPKPTHEPLVTVDLFKAARAMGNEREGSRSGASLNVHPFTKRSYVMRSYVVCAQCERRMAGGARHTRAYMVCQPSTNHGKDAALKFPGHPASVWVRQDVLVERILDFFADRVIGPNRHEYARQESAAGSARQKKLAKEAGSSSATTRCRASRRRSWPYTTPRGPAGGVDRSAAASDAHAPRASAACSYANGALGRIRTYATGSGGRCSIP